MSTEQRSILVTNDDGITAPGIRQLVDVARSFGKVTVVAPDSPQSGMGHAVTISRPIRLEKTDLFDGIESYECSGTPADCVKVAVDQILHRKPDLVLSGINHGSNASINVLYSGTMSAAIEGAIEGIPSLGFSLTNYSRNADFGPGLPFIRRLIQRVITQGLPEGTLLNVNIPNPEDGQVKGIKVCRQAKAKWEENFAERTDPHGRNYYWLVGIFKDYDQGEDTDLYALSKGYVSVVPTLFDLTDHHFITNLNTWNLNE
ncbi:MAG: 5'/3'-nucleotidase SurE [Bacteroidetes bacterium]|nr:5'/3'-nucleotidase SurE [Bacteroidota bacterium]